VPGFGRSYEEARNEEKLVIASLYALWAVAAQAANDPPLETRAAPSPATASFRIGGVAYRLEIPPGYCMPQGRDLEVSRAIDAADDRNVAHLTLVACGKAGVESSDDYFVVMTPKSALFATVERDAFLNGLGAAFDDPKFTAFITSRELYDEVGRKGGAALGASLNLTGDIRPLGKDQMCAYMGGTMQARMETGSYEMAMGACMTAVGGRALGVCFYGRDTSSAAVTALLMRSKHVAEAIRVDPAG
jgi:hypothetical protein